MIPSHCASFSCRACSNLKCDIGCIRLSHSMGQSTEPFGLLGGGEGVFLLKKNPGIGYARKKMTQKGK